ncbi:glycosyltransferase family 2 protein [Silvibacterium acidisoli]|uniref:glycosyltransferase family 2 protein n=1 Tax=Acidobacteriaceae bacterium ZG23-2 TaxID=2883246 RepID=UPI00406CB5BB
MPGLRLDTTSNGCEQANEMDLSIIIVNWNSTDYLRQCLLSIYRETAKLTFEVIVIDNCSRDNSCSELVHSSFPQVILHCSDQNIGFARACNLGADLSKGRALLFLNPDTEIHDDVFSRMIEAAESRSNVGAVGVRLLNSDGSLQMSSVQAYPTILNQLLDSEFLRRKWPNSKLWGIAVLFADSREPSHVDAISGACLMVTREAWSVVKGFDSQYFMYVEDIDLCQRISQAGFSLLYLNDCEVVHHGGKSSAVQGRYFANLRQQQATLQYFRATRGHLYSACYRCSMALAAGIRVLIIVCTMPFRSLANRAVARNFSLEKWLHIFRWAVGLNTASSR